MSMKFIFLFLFLLFPFLKTTSPAFLAPIAKDLSTQKYLLSIYLNTPPHPTNLLLDLAAPFTLIDCLQTCKTSATCGSTTTLTRKPPLTGQPLTGSLSMPVTEGFNPGQLGSIPGFRFSCNKRSSLRGLVKSAAGFAGLGRSNLSIPAQVSNFSSEGLVFALCMSGSPSAPGVAFFGSSGPYYFIPEIDLSKHLNYTPLLINPSTMKSYSNNPSSEYFIGLTSVKVNGKSIDFDRTLLSIDEKGVGGTKLSTVISYTLLHSSIFKALTNAFVNESAALNLTVTEPVKPFKVCYKADDVTSSRVGPDFPTVDFVMQDDDVSWRIFGSNSMVRIYREGVLDVWCLGFLEGGDHPRTSIVIGGHQMEDNLLQFDLESGRLGFSSSVLVHGTMCANFNFTTNNKFIL